MIAQHTGWPGLIPECARARLVLAAADKALVSLPLSPAASHVNDAFARVRCTSDVIYHISVRYAMCQCPVLVVLTVCFARILCVTAWTANDDFMSHNRYVISPDHLLPYQNQGSIPTHHLRTLIIPCKIYILNLSHANQITRFMLIWITISSLTLGS